MTATTNLRQKIMTSDLWEVLKASSNLILVV